MGFTPEQLDAMERQSSGGSSVKTAKKKYTAAELDAMESQSKSSLPKEPGLLQSTVQSVVKPFARFGASAMNVLQGGVATAAGLTHLNNHKELAKDTAILKGLKDKEYNLGYFGKVKGIGGTGSLGGDIKDAAGTALETASNIIPAGKVLPLAKMALGGKILSGLKTGASTGLKSGTLYGAGSELQNKDASIGSTLAETAKGAAYGTIGGGVTGGLLPLPVGAAKGVAKAVNTVANPTTIMNRIAKVSPTATRTFNKLSGGQTPGDYLTQRGIYGNTDEVIQKLSDRFRQSLDTKDAEIAKLGGTWQHDSVKAALDQLVERESRVSIPGALSKDFLEIDQLANKYKSGGLSMTEINRVKQIFEKNIKLGYLKENNADKTALATNIDDALRSWQDETAQKLGLKNLPELSKEVQLSRQLGDALLKKATGRADDAGIDFLDAVILSGGNPLSLAIFGARKGIRNQRLQSNIAKFMGGEAKIPPVAGKTRAGITDTTRLLEAGDGRTTNAIPVGAKADRPFTEAELQANRDYQNSRIQQTRKALPPGNPEQSYINKGAPIPVLPKQTVEPAAKTIRSYDSFQKNQSNSTQQTIPANSAISPIISQKPTNYEPYIQPENLPVIDFGKRPKAKPSQLPTIRYDSGKVGVAPLAALGVGSAGAVAANVPSTTAYDSSSREVKEAPKSIDETISNKPQSLNSQQKTSKFNRANFTKKIVHVENRGARDAGKNLYESVGRTNDLGKYQVSPPSLAAWSKAWLGKTYTPEQFLKDPEAQETFFNEFMNVVERLNLSPDEAAITWHRGWGELGTGDKSTRDSRFRKYLKKEMANPSSLPYLTTFRAG